MLVSWLNYRFYQWLRFKVFWINAVGQTTPTGLFCKNSNLQIMLVGLTQSSSGSFPQCFQRLEKVVSLVSPRIGGFPVLGEAAVVLPLEVGENRCWLANAYGVFWPQLTEIVATRPSAIKRLFAGVK